MREEALRAGELVDEVPHAYRLVGRQDLEVVTGLLDVARRYSLDEDGEESGDVAEQTDGHLAVEEEGLDEVHEMVDLVVHRVVDQRGVPVAPRAAELVEQPAGIERVLRELLALGGVSLRQGTQRPIGRDHALADHVELVVEHEEAWRRAVRREGLGIEHRAAADVEEAPVHLVHGQEGGGHAAGGGQELSPAHSELLGGAGGELLRSRFDALLFLGLANRHVLPVRHELSGDR